MSGYNADMERKVYENFFFLPPRHPDSSKNFLLAGIAGIQVPAGTVDYANMERFLTLLRGGGPPTLRP